MAREIAFSHHEHWDGSGYPKGLAGEEIPLAARIVAIADVYDALCTKRVYKEPLPHKKCVAMIREGAGKQFDPLLVEIFLKLESEFHEIALNFRETAEDLPSEPAFAAENAECTATEAEISLDDKFSEIDAMLDECAGDHFATGETATTRHGSAPSNREPPQNTPSTDLANELSLIELELENVS
jgi:hypothetical protein